MELRDAIANVATIQLHLARAQIFRGYQSAPVALTGLLAFLAGALQPTFAPRPTVNVSSYALYWAIVAGLSLAICLAGIWLRYRRNPTRLARAATLSALQQLSPAIVAGALATFALVRGAPEHAETLPGLWQVLLSLGIFASAAQLPRACVAVGFFYLLCGTISLALAGSAWAFSPWLMALPFGIGQLSAAGILYWTLEQADGEES